MVPIISVLLDAWVEWPNAVSISWAFTLTLPLTFLLFDPCLEPGVPDKTVTSSVILVS